MEFLTDIQINSLLNEQKILTSTVNNPPTLGSKPLEYKKVFELRGISGNEFRLIIRKSKIYNNNFSIILALNLGEKKQLILIRYNGNWHKHTNKIERNRISGFHIHRVTERYQRAGLEPDGFAETTNRYNDWNSAFNLMLINLNIIEEGDRFQKKLTDF